MGKITHVDGIHLRYAFQAGTRCLGSSREHLNLINVFPVPDGDTGTNMFSTMSYISSHAIFSRSFSRTFISIAETALLGARGNSGLILAQYLYGLSQVFDGHERISTKDFGQGVMLAFPFALKALSKPEEGTIITVLREWSQAVDELSRVSQDFMDVLDLSLETARRSLSQTTEKLKPLKDAGVVDAGALGFVRFIQGILESGKDRTTICYPSDDGTISRNSLKHSSHDESTSFRYCTEIFLEGIEDLPVEKIREDLSRKGDSLVISGADKRLRIHIHTNEPSEIAVSLKKWGDLTHQKVDDMYRQQKSLLINNSRNKVALLTDSACDLPQEILDSYNIHVIPMKLTIGKDEYLDKLTIKPEQVYRRMNSSDVFPVSSMPSQGEFMEIYSKLLEIYDSVIAIHLSDKLSGTFNASYQAASGLGMPERVSVINSRNLCVSLGLIVLEAASALGNGCDHREVVRIVNTSLERAFIYVSLADLKYMVRGGRISPMKGHIARFLNLKPVISVDKEGKGIHCGKVCGRNANLSRIRDLFMRHWVEGKVSRYAVVHAGAEAEAAEFAEKLFELTGKRVEYIMEISPVIGINSGPGSLAVGGV